MLHKACDRKCSVEKIAGRELKSLVAKMNWLTVNRQLWSDSHSADWEFLMCALENCRVCELAIAL
jgi:hypothetical protein